MSRKKGSKNKIKEEVKEIITPVEVIEKPIEQEVPTPIKDIYSVTLQLNEKEYQGEGNTLIEAFDKIRPDAFKAKGILIAKKGDREAKLILFPFEMKRLFSKFNTFIRRNLQKKKSEQLDRILK